MLNSILISLFSFWLHAFDIETLLVMSLLRQLCVWLSLDSLLGKSTTFTQTELFDVLIGQVLADSCQFQALACPRKEKTTSKSDLLETRLWFLGLASSLSDGS